VTSKRIAPEHIKVDTSETAVRITQEGTGNAFVVEDATNPDSTPFVIDNQGRVGVKKTPTRDLDVDGLIAATNIIPGYTTTVTSAGTTTLTVTSAQQQFFTGTLGHTVTLPVASTLSLGQFFTVHNNSTGALTVNSSGGNLIYVIPPRSTTQVTCVLLTGTTAASWDASIPDVSGYKTTETSNGTSVLTVSSEQRQFFTGSANHTVTLPVVSTLVLGQFYEIHNNSTGTLVVNSSDNTLVFTFPPGQTAVFTAIAVTGTGPSSWDIDTSKTAGYETTVTSVSEKFITLASGQQQFFTGTDAQLIRMPVTSTLVLGDYWVLHNNSTDILTVRSSGTNNILVIPAGSSAQCTCILVSGTTEASWDAEFIGNSGITGTGTNVLSISPTFTDVPSAPTATAGTDTTQIATTAFVRREVSDLVDASPETLDTLNELAAALGDDPNFATTVANNIATKVSKTGDTMSGDLEVTGDVKVLGTDKRFIGSGAVYRVTSATRPVAPVSGDVIYETDTKLFFGWDGTLWKSIGGGAKGGGNDDVFYENATIVTTNYAITAGKNAMTSGPISINAGVVIEIPSGSVWTVV